MNQPGSPAHIDLNSTQELTFIEFFAGDNRVWKAVRAAGYEAAKVDITYLENHGCQNPMDINSNAGMGFHP